MSDCATSRSHTLTALHRQDPGSAANGAETAPKPLSRPGKPWSGTPGAAETAPAPAPYRNGTSPIVRRSLRVCSLVGSLASRSIARTAHITCASFEEV